MNKVVLKGNDYYPFGMLVPQRNYSSPSYRYGFQGQEKDDEVKGSGNSYTAEFWQYDSRVGKRWNRDPIVKKHESPYATYATFANNPIWFRDLYGKDTISVTGKEGNSIRFIHNDLKKRNINLPFNLGKSATFNFNKGDGKLPDVLGYSLSITATGEYFGHAGSVSISKNYAIFTRGKFNLNPFPYAVGAIHAGVDLEPTEIGGDISGTFSPFFANAVNVKNKDKYLTPDSWTGAFGEFSLAGSGFLAYGGGVGLTGFASPGVDSGHEGYIGASIDVSVGLGGGTNEGASGSLLVMPGISYYILLERHPEPTLKLMNSWIGKTRLALKWTEFMTGGMFNGTEKSDLIKDTQNIFSNDSKEKK